MKELRWPTYYAEQLEVGDRNSCVALCTAWTRRKRIARALPSNSFNIVGNLYSRDGVNYIIRNVLANPAVRHIVLCGRVVTDSADALVALFRDGVDGDWRIVGNGGQIDREIPFDAIERFRTCVKLHDLRGITSLSAIAQTVHELPQLPPFGEAEVFPEAERIAVTLPSETSGFVIRGETIPEVWVQLLSHIMTFGRMTPTEYGRRQKELLGVMAILEGRSGSGTELPGWMPMTTAEVNRYSEKFLIPDEEPGVAYSYGHRLRSYWGLDQIERMAKDLQRYQFSRRAVACLWDPKADPESEDPPCVDLVQAMIRDQKLHLTVYVRSNDIYRAWPQNVAGLERLQTELVERLEGKQPGDLVVVSQSAHIYEDCWAKARNILERKESMAYLAPQFRQDIRGSFVIKVESGRITVDHYSPQGDRLRTLSAKNARELEEKLSPYVSLSRHAMYVGRELARAEIAMQQGANYKQDKVQ